MPGALFVEKLAGVGPSSSRPGPSPVSRGRLPRLWDRGRSGLLPSPGEALFDCLPVDGVPPGREVVGPAVLVLQIVGVLPDVHAEDRLLVLHQRAVLVRPAENLELAAAPHQPPPTGAELADRGIGQLLLEGIEAAEVPVNGARQVAARLAAAARRHDLPEQAVIGMAAAVVAHRRADRLRYALDPAEQVLDRLLLQ